MMPAYFRDFAGCQDGLAQKQGKRSFARKYLVLNHVFRFLFCAGWTGEKVYRSGLLRDVKNCKADTGDESFSKSNLPIDQ